MRRSGSSRTISSPADCPSASTTYARHLAGRPLGCTCRLDEACHADVLLRVANPGALGVAHSSPPVRSSGAAVASVDMGAGLTAQERRRTEAGGGAGYGAGRSASGSAAADISGIGNQSGVM
ncbi:DUF4326 domain-containing protein [Rhodococcus qingshengii]|uniref:DUF4326 domain-containing protein n=1 Tax=Rhodococcus qingshengii TaxID=334542 RepID=UPI002E2655F9